jgi:hypothetical protein
MMKRLTISLTVAAFAILALVATVAAASPTPSPTPVQARGQGLILTILGLTRDQVMDLRIDGLSLAQIAARQDVDPQKLIDALKNQWTTRIEARLENGALTAAEAATLKTQVAERAKAMVEQTTMGGMRGAAVGAGPGAMGAGNGAGMGAGGMGGRGGGTCDGTGPNGQSAP